MRFLLYSLGRALSDRVLSFLEGFDTVNCPSAQRLHSSLRHEDIVLLRSDAAEKDMIKQIVGKERTIIFYPDDARKHNSFDSAIMVSESCTEYELRDAINQISSSDYISSVLSNALAGSSELMRKTRKQLRSAIDSTIPVHIVGETGTGKTLAAKLIHDLSSLNGRMVMESCGCLANSIADSELFGHSKGAFSGALDNREGLLASANGSTLFLDEIQDLPIDIQTKLLRVLDTGEFRKLGSDRITKTSFRLITASNMTLSSLLEQKRIRKDFYYRISGIEIRMPSLDEHPEDIPEILQVFSRQKDLEKAIDYSIFMHPYPGNVRELFREAELYLDRIRH